MRVWNPVRADPDIDFTVRRGSSLGQWEVVPFVSSGLSMVSKWISGLFIRGAQREAATQVVNLVEPKMQENLKAYMESDRSPESQSLALQNFDRLWQAVLEGCGQPKLGKAGRRCIEDRQRGGRAPWCSTGTGCDWFALYRDPIANDPVPKQIAEQGSPAGILSSTLGDGNLLLIAGAGLVAVAALSSGRKGAS